ncbi:DUF1127 domain-containing protein [Roseomonas sp. OT10]|uniref:DUF1127 domain-containing protein n=1 Tax=Roseomonas cutis TaxID=2897332 RepID=UPI001E368BC0|nr:DUF1127 domain-containing protein [Roseomonas sp. OT10]UFN49029.1 DUF1127 domain-containing protein [Roseomonas sp. OT10]
MSAHTSPVALVYGAGAPASRGQRAMGWMHAVFRVFQAIESRRLLAEMDDRMLSDIGISRSEADHEANRAPWDLAAPSRRG